MTEKLKTVYPLLDYIEYKQNYTEHTACTCNAKTRILQKSVSQFYKMKLIQRTDKI